MKKQKIKDKLFLIFSLILLLLILPLQAANSEPEAKSKKVVLKTVTLLKRGHPVNYPVTWIAEQVKKRTNGELEIQIIGGPEAIPAFEQTDALSRGVIDFYVPGSSYVQTVWPEAIVFPLSRLTPTQERQQGAFDILEESAKKKGLFYLGRSVYPRGYYMFINLEVKTPEDLRGKKIRGAPIYARFLKALGVSMVTTPFGEVYTALERGVIDGYCWPPSICDYRLHEVTKFMINHPFYGANILVVMNHERWNKLPTHLQKLLKEVVEEQEKGMEQRWRDLWNKELEDIKAGKVKFIEFSSNDGKKYVDLAYTEAWKEVIEKSPEYGLKLRKIMVPES